jgi:hypothetical protein
MNAQITNLTGRQGGQVIVDTAAYTPPTGASWHAIQIVQQAVIAAVTASSPTNATALVGLVLPAGLVIYGNFTALTLTSGKVIAYTT